MTDKADATPVSPAAGQDRAERALSSADLDRSFAEHTIVRATEPIRGDTGVVPKGAWGTIVYVHGKSDAFEVEFDAPHHAVLTVFGAQITRDGTPRS